MIPLVKTYIAPREEMMPAIESVLYSGYIAEGEEVYSFERELRDYLENPYTLAMQSGTAALHIALLLAGAGPGYEVISTALTAEPTNTTIALTGAKIVWADVDIQTGLLDPISVKEKISEKTKAIVLVHYAGMVCNMDKFNQISEEFGIPIIEDAAHALGSQYNGKPVGSNSKYNCFSFQAIKHMTTVDGGALSLKTEEDFSAARKLRWFGLDKSIPRLENDITRAGYKYGMNNVIAAIGRVQLKHIENVIKRHIENGRFYDEALKGISGITQVPYYLHTQPSYWLYTMKVENREEFKRLMESEGVNATELHLRSDRHSVFKESKCELPVLDEFYSKLVHIPCGWWVTDEDRSRIVSIIKKGW